jgi:hypothetical protein
MKRGAGSVVYCLVMAVVASFTQPTKADQPTRQAIDAYLTDAVFDQAQVEAANCQRARGIAANELHKLEASAGRWKFEFMWGITSFLDSGRFPALLLVVFPIAALAVRAMRRQMRRSGQQPLITSRLQFTVSRLLCVASGICLFLGIGHWSSNGAFSFAMVTAAFMMVTELFRRRVSRRFAACVLAIALGYAAANVALYYLIFLGDHPSLIFERRFVLPAGVFGPLLTVLGVAACVLFRRQLRSSPPWTALAGLTIWMSGVSVANLHVIGLAIAAV